MESPYLNSGEAIILTTNRVSADAVMYDVMLTTERIFLIDNQKERFEPRIIPLTTILSVQGGKTPANDPVITLLFRSGEVGNARQPLNLVFSQNPAENRKPERDDWMRSLIQLSINQHEREVVPETPVVSAATGETGLRPAVRHGVAPEMVRPLSNIVDHRTAVTPVTVIPDEVEGGGEIPARASAILPKRDESLAPEQGAEKSATGITPVRVSPPRRSASPARVIIPQIVEEALPAPAGAAPPDEQEEPATLDDSEARDYSIQTPVPSLTVTEKPAPEPLQVMEPAMEPADPVIETGDQEHAADHPPPAAAEPRDMAEIIRTLHTDAGEPVTTEQSDTAPPGTVHEPVHANLDAGIQEIPESHVTLPIPKNGEQESVGHPVPEAVFLQEPAAQKTPPGRHPLLPAHEIHSNRTTLVYTAVLILIVALVAAGAVLLLSQGSGHPDKPVIPSLTMVQVTTLPPETVRPTTVPPAIEPPAATRIATPTPSLPASSVPQAGVWVRVNSTAYYIGNVGNPGLVQPVSGKGDIFYKILRNDRPVQVSVQKQDNSGALLAVAIYRDGTLVGSRSVTSPMGSVDLLIDPLTSRAPGLTENDTLPEHAATPTGLENY